MEDHDELEVIRKMYEEEPPDTLTRGMVDAALADLYEYLIGEPYQDAWKVVAEVFQVEEFDWQQGERPHTEL